MSTKSLRVLICAVLLNSFATCERAILITGHATDSSCSAPSELKICTLNADSFKGEIGSPGERGDKGDTGRHGKNGLNGSDCKNGENGTTGAPGVKGDEGPKGFLGEKGEKGKQGSTPGSEGPKGDTGAPGTPGTCGCDPDIEVMPKVKLGWGKDEPGTVTCRHAPIDESDTYYIMPGQMQVFCDHESKKTCVKHASNKTVSYTESEPFWLSQKNVSLGDIYNLTSDQLSWLQRESYTADLTIRYHCMNSVPLGKDAMMLLSWNDMMISNKPTSSSPFHYHVQNDGCLTAGKNEWNYTDIVLISPIAQRLPIVDFFIKDVRNTTQSLRIEILQLCFG